ncbi:MAG: hypothetical protein WBB60_16915 [Nitrospira sp.]|nr:hypothetical protein [Nitrospira sp.]MBP6604299.1 hypothetical protein [Nitrospira sp.]HQY59347.1 hypothetical protein [Nitrospira sp.]
MVYLLGVGHQVQHNGPPMTPEREHATRDFCTFLKSRAKDLNISMLAEEFSEDALRISKAHVAIVKDVAHSLGLKHLFCDPTRQERVERGINNNLESREQYWLSRLEHHYDSETILLVCGADHLESFREKLQDKGVKAEILPDQFGIGLPPLMITEKSGVFLDF